MEKIAYNYSEKALNLLKTLISTPSMSREENNTAEVLASFFSKENIPFKRQGHNLWATNKFYDAAKPNIILNSHHDTVKPNKSYTRDPFSPDIENGKLYGLGSNDAGGPLVCLIMAFVHYFPQENLPYNLIIAATAEEEISGTNGIASILALLPEPALAIVGEPTLLDIAIAEKGLMVLDCIIFGKAGHAARNEGINAINESLAVIEWFHNYQFKKTSDQLGPVKMTVSVIKAGTQHNVVPDRCELTVDIRTTDAYSNQETLDIIKQQVKGEVKARSTRLNPSGIALKHPAVQKAISLGAKPYGSPTLSDQALIPYPSIKMGPGDSARSHTADEFIFVEEITQGIARYISLLDGLEL